MGVKDLWHLKKKPHEKKPQRSKRYGRGMRWRVSWEDPHTGKTETLHYDTKPEAEAKWVEIQAGINRGTYTNPKAGQKLVSVYADEWLAGLVLRETTKAGMESRWRNHVKPVLGDKHIGQVTPSAIQHWVRSRQELPKPLAASTIRMIYHTVVHPLFAQAVIDDLRGRSPCVGIKLPELPKGTYDLPTSEQVHSLYATLPDRYKPVPFLGAGCGWRWGEIFGAEHWKGEQERCAFDFLRRDAHVRQQLSYVKGVGLCLAPPKSKTSYRTNELPTLTAQLLAQHIERFPPIEIELPDRTNPDKPTTRIARLLFADDDGRPLHRSEWSRIWNKALKDAGLPPGMFTLRSLRHYFATTLIFNGATVKSVQLACGHSTPTITLNTYLGYWPGDERLGTRKLLDDALGTTFLTQSVPVLAR